MTPTKRFFFDTEFIEDGKTIDLISIGIVCEDGRSFYGMNLDCDHSKASEWVKKNVLALLPEKPGQLEYDNSHREQGWYRKIALADEVARFLGAELLPVSLPRLESFGSIVRAPDHQWQLLPENPIPEIWAYYADYDWVVLCQLWGTMMDLPKGFPMYCRDLKQWCDSVGDPTLPEQFGEHNALEDAKWNAQVYDFLYEHF